MALSGTGRLKLLGVDTGDKDAVDQAMAAYGCIRLRAHDFCQWVGGGEADLLKEVRRACRDVVLSLNPIEYQSKGGSNSLAMFIALLRLFFKAKIRPKLAATGMVSLNGSILMIDRAAFKVKKALKRGAALILVPVGNEAEVRQEIPSLDESKVKFVETVVDVVEYAVIGESREGMN